MKKKKLGRNQIALAAWNHTGAGKHHNRTADTRKGKSRKVKHKGRGPQGCGASALSQKVRMHSA